MVMNKNIFCAVKVLKHNSVFETKKYEFYMRCKIEFQKGVYVLAKLALRFSLFQKYFRLGFYGSEIILHLRSVKKNAAFV